MVLYELLQRLYSINTSKVVKYNLHNIQALCKALGSPEKKIKCIHVAGTNGKGSCATKIATALQLSGHKTGLYTSPHISSFRERIRVSGQMISEEDLTRLLRCIFDLIDKNKLDASFFEIATALMFTFFVEQAVDVAVIETGLGGRLDATNICNSILTVITSISYDHTELLGDSLESIATEKAGIMKGGVPCVIGPHVPFHVFEKKAQELSCPLFKVEQFSTSFEEENLEIARCALDQLKKCIPLDEEAIANGLQSLPPCRFEIVPKSKLEKVFHNEHTPKEIILDVGHNPAGIERLLQLVRKRFFQTPIHVVAGFSKSKDIESCLKVILQYADSLMCIEAPLSRAIDAELVAQLAREIKNKYNSLTQIGWQKESIQGMKLSCKEAANCNAVLIICGSFFIMRDIRRYLGYNEPQDPFELNEQNKWNKP